MTDYWAGLQDYGILQHTKYARLAHDFVISPTVINHLQVGFSRRWRREGALANALDDIDSPTASAIQSLERPDTIWARFQSLEEAAPASMESIPRCS